jgi:hypothetical protein
MSKIVTPYPPPLAEELISAKPGHAWWRLPLRPNADGHVAVMVTNGDLDTATWSEYEIFDGEDTIIDAGFDKPIGALRVSYHTERGDYIDILSETVPSPSPSWRQLTPPGFPHPDD